MLPFQTHGTNALPNERRSAGCRKGASRNWTQIFAGKSRRCMPVAGFEHGELPDLRESAVRMPNAFLRGSRRTLFAKRSNRSYPSSGGDRSGSRRRRGKAFAGRDRRSATPKVVGQAHRLPSEIERQAVRLPYNPWRRTRLLLLRFLLRLGFLGLRFRFLGFLCSRFLGFAGAIIFLLGSGESFLQSDHVFA